MVICGGAQLRLLFLVVLIEFHEESLPHHVGEVDTVVVRRHLPLGL